MLLALWFVAFARSSSYYPELPVQYISNFILFDTESTIVPPYTDYLPPGSVSFGTTFYDWTLRSMVEVYRDKCVDIFPGGNDFGCHFINIQNRTLLTRQFANGTEDCCVYQPRWFPPPPDFLRFVCCAVFFFDCKLTLFKSSCCTRKWNGTAWCLSICS
jgi:hypothetical protein